ncbi:hypothetical protein TWF694_003186 [Orbilia ellipsospora]|uniref:ABC transporter domain-containing protein n=1 Tax=Orbilia ellipsospora TaxID=2528407 RepID=A0AAV9X160_9PEZI
MEGQSGPGLQRGQEGVMAIYTRQIWALCHKNLKLFLRRPLVMLFRVLLAPIIIAVILAEFKHIGSAVGFGNDNGGVADLRPIKSVASALENQQDTKIVFARNGFDNVVDPIIDRFTARTGAKNVVRVGNSTDIMANCRINLAGASDCFAAIIFNNANGTLVDYIIAQNPTEFSVSSDWRSHKSIFQDRVFPIQFALDSAIANLPQDAVVNEQTFRADFSALYDLPDSLSGDSSGPTLTGEIPKPNTNGYYFVIAFLLAPFFFIIFTEMVFHVCGFLTRERESGVTELLTTQGCRQTPQIVSYVASFWLLYIPTWIITGIILGAVLFTSTNTGYLILFQILAGTATLCMCVFLQSLFTKGHFSSPVSALITLALAMVIFKYLFAENPQTGEMAGLSAVFPPFAYASLIADIARLESITLGFKLSRSPADIKTLTTYASIAPYLYVIFFLIQIPLYLGLAVASHFSIWHVPYIVKPLSPETGLAMRINGLRKTFKSKKAVDGLSMEVKSGQVVCLLGPNGGGKTTTLKCIGGVIKADKGSSMELGCERTQLGFCPQHNCIWPQLTVREHVQIWLGIKGRKISKTERDAAVVEMVRECDLIEKIDGRAGSLSGGQKRKLQLAISFIGGSKIVCIDEASSGVDPLSRQNIWQIIQQGAGHRTILLTTHFLDEADVLSDHIFIMSKGQLVVEGSTTALKAQYGDGYSIYDDHTLTNKIGHARTSAEASQKLQELSRGDPQRIKNYEVEFPTLEQVFLRVANGESLNEEHRESENGEEAAHAAESHPALGLDKGRPINKFRQIQVLFKKRFKVLPHNWLAIIITLLIPIAVTAALMNGAGNARDIQASGGLHNCAYQLDQFQKATNNIRSSAALSRAAATSKTSTTTTTSSFGYQRTPVSAYPPFYDALQVGSPASLSSADEIVVGPASVFSNSSDGYKLMQNIFPAISSYSYSYPSVNSPSTSLFDNLIIVNNVDNYTKTLPMGDNQGSKACGIYAPSGETPQIALSSYHIALDTDYGSFYGVDALSVVDNMLSKNNKGPAIRTALRELRQPIVTGDFFSIAWAMFLAMSTLAGFTACIIYPTYERVQRTRALQYSNGVSPVSLWSAYLLFELQLIILVAIVMIILLSIGAYTKMFYGLGYCFGAIILTGIATTLGCFILSLYFSAKLAYVMATIIHLVLLFLYLVAVILVQQYAPALHRFEVQNQLAAGLGLTSPAANLMRAFLLATNTYSTLCGEFGEIANPSNPFAFSLFGGVYFNLILQIVFLSLILFAFEYSFFSRMYYRFRRPAHSRARNSMEIELSAVTDEPKRTSIRSATGAEDNMNTPLLDLFALKKSFNGVQAVHDVTLSVSSNETMALLGPNGAGKSTTINMIRGELKPDSGDILVRNKSILTQLVEARAETGVCPQEDAVDDLTVFSTLKCYAEVRGVPDADKNARLVMDALGIQSFKDKRVSKLSGGTRRKLSVAIALLGNPPVLLLDEPSTGLDAVSKRTLWKTLKALGRGRATLLTTHSMEEVEALATNVSIIAVKLLASGTTSSLRDQYGGSWHVRAVIDPRSASGVEGVIRHVFAGMVEDYVVQGTSGQIRFGLKKGDEGCSFVEAMNEMERLKGEGRIVEYSLNGTTLQEVFLNVCGKERFAK